VAVSSGKGQVKGLFSRGHCSMLDPNIVMLAMRGMLLTGLIAYIDALFVAIWNGLH
jgi:hypothetical protein